MIPTTCSCGRELPLTVHASDPETTSLDERSIRTIVDDFYGRALADPVLGPVFDRHVGDWAGHLSKMYDFWSGAALRTGRYRGRPIEAHRPLPGLTVAHFERWLDLWEPTVRRHLPDERDAQVLIGLARRMGWSMTERLGLAPAHDDGA